MQKLSLNGDTGRLTAAIKSLMSLAQVVIPGDGADRRAWVVDQINEFIDVPILSESAERAILEAMVDVIYELADEFRN